MIVMDVRESDMAQGIGTVARDMNCDDENYPIVQLTKSLTIKDVYSESGAILEIAENQKPSKDCTDDNGNFFNDESLFKSLSFGAGNALFDDDDEDSGSDDDAEAFEKLSRKMEDMTGDGGVLKMEVRPGIGGDIPSRAYVTFHYSAYLQYSDEPFDSSWLRGKPEKKKLDFGELLPGLNIAIKTMRKDETARFLVKSSYAFGKLGCQPRIPSNETILYEIYVISFIDCDAADVYENLDSKEEHAATFQEKLEAARGFHRKGNEHYHEGNLFAAKDAYFRAAWIMEDAHLKDEKEEEERGTLLIKMHSNLAQVFLDMNEPARACTRCNKGLAVRGVHSKDLIAKVYFRYGKAKCMLHDFKGARKALLHAQRLKPNNMDISSELEMVLLKEQKYEAQEQLMYKQMFEPLVQSSAGTLTENVVKVRPEFERVVEQTILRFIAEPNMNELQFPSSLSPVEIACVTAAAKAAECIISVKPNGAETILKIMKKTVQ